MIMRLFTQLLTMVRLPFKEKITLVAKKASFVYAYVPTKLRQSRLEKKTEKSF